MMLSAKILFQFCEGLLDAMDRFIDDDAIFLIHEGLQHRLASLLHGEESEIEILMTVNSTRDKGREHS